MLSAAVTLCALVIFHKLSGHEAKPSERTTEFPCTEGESGRSRERRARWESIEGHMTGSNRAVGDSVAIWPRARLQSDSWLPFCCCSDAPSCVLFNLLTCDASVQDKQSAWGRACGGCRHQEENGKNIYIYSEAALGLKLLSTAD